MGSAAEAKEFIVGQFDEFAKSLSSDLQLRPVNLRDQENENGDPVSNLLRKKMMEQGLSGEIMLFGARSRRHWPVGLPVYLEEDSGDQEKYALGLYVYAAGGAVDKPTFEEVGDKVKMAMKAFYESARTIRNRPPIKDPVRVVSSRRLRLWAEKGVFPKVTTDHHTNETEDDRGWAEEKNTKFLERYVSSLLVSIGQLAKYGLKPKDLSDVSAPVRQIGGYTHIYAGAFLRNQSYVLGKELVGERDEHRCQMPLMRKLNSAESGSVVYQDIEVCGRNLENYFPHVGPTRHRIVLGQAGDGQANHVIARGAGMSAAIKAAWAGEIPLHMFDSPDVLLMAMSALGVGRLFSLNGIDLSTDETRRKFLQICARLMPKVYAAINNVGNLLLLDSDHHHGLYHPDERLAQGISSLLCLVNGDGGGKKHRYVVPDMGTKRFDEWVDENYKLVIENQRFGDFAGNFGNMIEYLQQARMLVAMQNQPYWQDVATNVMLFQARVRTENFATMKTREAEAAQLANIYGQNSVGETPPDELIKLVETYFSTRRLIINQMSPGTDDSVAKKLLADLGIPWDEGVQEGSGGRSLCGQRIASPVLQEQDDVTELEDDLLARKGDVELEVE